MTSWVRFFAALLPAATELLRALYRRHDGNIAAAREELREIRDHGTRLDEAEAAVDARIEAVRGREKS